MVTTGEYIISQKEKEQKVEHSIALFSLFKVGLITILLGFVVIANLFTPSPELLKTHMQWTVLSLVSVAYASLIVTALVLKYRFVNVARFFIAVLFSDLLVTSILVHVTGGAVSPYAVLFLVPVIAAAIIYSTLWSVSFTFTAITLYFLVSILGWHNVLPSLAGQLILPSAMSATELVRRLSLNAAAFAMVAALSIYLNHRLYAYESVVESTKKEFLEFKVRHRDILNSLDAGVLSLDKSGIILNANRAARVLLGLSGKKLGHIKDLGSEFHHVFEQELKERRLKLKNGEGVRHLDCSLLRLRRKGREMGFVFVVRDRTEQEQLEQEVIRQNHLAGLGRLAAGIAHEIRNPLASITGSLELVRQELGDDIKGDLGELLEIVFGETARLNELITSLLNYTRIRPLNFMETDLGIFIYETVTFVKADPRAVGTDIIFALPDAEVVASFDPDALRQVLLNLIINALEVPTVTRVELSLRSTERAHVIWIEDNGPGIDREARKLLFEPFYTTKEGGTGLGLAIAAKQVEKHSGRINIDESHMGGAKFAITLPRERSEEHQ